MPREEVGSVPKQLRLSEKRKSGCGDGEVSFCPSERPNPGYILAPVLASGLVWKLAC